MQLCRKGGGAGSASQELLLPLIATVLWIASPTCSQITFTNPPIDLVVAEGSPARFDCEFSTSTSVSISWEKDGATVTPVGRFSYLVNGSLSISPAQAGDNGTYSCVVADQSNQQREERSASLTFAFILNSFLSSPDSQTVAHGATLFLFCIHGGSLPAATIMWTRDNDIIVTSSRIFIQQSTLGHTNPPQVSSSLAIASAMGSDSGSYACVASNPLLAPSTAVTSTPATVIVRAPLSIPVIIQHPTDIIAIPGQSAILSCSFSGEPPPSVAWSHDNVTLTPSSQVSVTTTGVMSSLTLSGIQESNSGEYRCMATNSQGSTVSQPAQLQIASIGTTFELQPQDTVIAIGGVGVLNCLSPPSLPLAQISWTKNFAQLPNNQRFTVLQNGSLMIMGAELEDQGVYYCTATNTLLGISRTSQPAQVTTIGVPTVVPSTVTVDSGQSVTLLCSARGNPAPTFSWFKGETQLLDSDPRLSITGGTLTISGIAVDDRGYYTCRATFVAGTTEARAYVSVRSLPEFVNTNISITTVVQSEVTLPCDIIPDPTVTFSWQFGGVLINPRGGTYTILPDGSLVVANVGEVHEGTYTCVVTNPLGVASGTVILTVNTPPTVTADSTTVVTIESNTVTLVCNATGDPVPVQTWSRNGNELTNGGRYRISLDGRVLTVQGVTEAQDEGEFTCHASNLAGNDSATLTLSVQVLPSAVATPTSQELSADEIASFDCITSGDPAPQVRWLNAMSVDVTSLSDPRIEVLTNGTLVITDLRASDQQQYSCEASSSVGRSTSTVSLLVTVAPSVSLSAATTATQGNPLSLDCNPIGQPSPSVTWYKDNVQLVPNSRVSIDGEDRLVFSSVISADGGSYRCEASNSAGMDSTTTTLTVLVPPIIQPAVLPVIANEGSRAVLDCVAMGNPPPTVSWFFNSVPLPSPSIPRIQQASNGSLVLSPVEKGDEGGYICRASNVAGMESATFQLRVYVAPDLSVAEPSVTVVEGGTATLTCLATGDPVPVQTWSRNGNELTSGGRYQISSDGRVLTVQGVTETQDEGEFTCHASNLAGNDSADITLNVLIPPRFTQPPTNSTAVEGAQHILTCAATGDPTPLVTWSSSDGMVVSSQGTLLFSSVARGDSGLYTCTASSSAGSVEVEIYLDVQYPPAILQPPQSQSVALNSTFVFVCITDGNPTPQISWLFNDAVIPGAVESSYTISSVAGTNGGQYTCRATNNIGTVSESATLTVLFPPSSPTLLLATATSPSTFSVQWTPSTNNGGSPITSYVIEYRDTSLTSGPFQSVRVGSDATSTQLSGLTAFVNYEIRVRGENAVGLSDPSNTISGRTHPDAPSAPGNFRVTSFSSSTVSLAWDIPDPLNGQLAAYELSYTDETTSVTNTRLLFAVTTFTISGLRMGVVYRVELRASTASLLGDFLYGPYAVLRVRDGVELEVPTEAPPTTPPPTTTEETEETTTPSDQGTTQAGVATTTDRQVGMTTATTMVATTTEDTGMTMAPPTTTEMEQSTTQPATTAAVLNPPSVAPSDLVVQPSAGQVFIVWREPSSGLDTFIGYQILISPAPPPPLTTPILRPSTPGMILYSYVVTGLANFTEYTITVATYNDDGVGPLTAQTTITTPETAPSAPQSVATVTSPSGAVIVSWLPPEPRNGVILQYLVQVLLGATDQTINSQTVSVGSSMAEQEMGRSVTFVGLDLDNFQYRIEVYASTGAGTGPSSIPVFIGMDPATNATTTVVDPPTSIMTVDDNTTSSATNEITSSPSTATESPTILRTTDALQTSIDDGTTTDDIQTTITVGGTEAPAPFRDAEYYIVRIVPPVVIALFILVIVVVVVMGCCCRSRMNRENKKGLYTVYPPGDYVMRNKHTLEGDHAVAGDDDVETSSYHIKDALDANFTYNSHSNRQPPSARQHGLRAGVNNQSAMNRGQLESGSGLRRQPYQPGTGQGHHGGWQQQQQHQQYPATTVGWRDAAEEPDSRPDSGEVEIMPAEVDMELGGERERESLGSQSEGSMGSLQRLPYQPGDYTHAELDAMRAKKAQQRAKRFGVDDQQRTPHDQQQHVHQQQQYQQYHHHQRQQMTSSAAAPRQQGPPTATPMIFDPNLGFSNGGIMETKIGAVGGKAARDHIPPEASAHMY